MELFSLTWWGYVVAGIGIFLFGMSFLGESLRKVAGNKLKIIIDKCTSNIFKGLLIGILITAVFQSSMATTLLVIGLISVGLMTLKQAIGVILGANIGTTMTAFIIGLNLTAYAPFFLFVGVVMIVFFNKQKVRQIGEVLLSFGLLFFGLSLMETSLSSLAENARFAEILISVGDKPFISLLIGALGTILVQSSSAFVGVVQSLYSAASGIDYTLAMAIPLLFGSTIGTAVSCLLATSGKNIAAKRAIAIRIIVNVLGSVVFMILLKPFSALMTWFVALIRLEPKMQIAAAHIAFNVFTTILVFPFIGLIVKGVTKLLPDKKSTSDIVCDLSALDHNLMEISPAMALSIAREQTIKMSDYALQSVALLPTYFSERKDEYKEKILKIEEIVDTFNERLTDFLHRLDHVMLSESDMDTYAEVLKTFRDIERISDHCENLAEFFSDFINSGEDIHPDASKEIMDMLDITPKMLSIAMKDFTSRRHTHKKELDLLEENLDNLNKQARENHVLRLATKQDKGNKYITVVFADITSNIERIGDHCTNIEENINTRKKSSANTTPSLKY